MNKQVPSLHVEGYGVSQSVDSGEQIVNPCPSLHVARIWSLRLAMWENPQPSRGRIWGIAINRFRYASCQPVPQPARGKDMGLAIGHVGNIFLSLVAVFRGDGASTWLKVH